MTKCSKIINNQLLEIPNQNQNTQFKMGQQCTHTIQDVQEVIHHHHVFQPSSEEAKLEIQLMRNKNQDLLAVAQKHILEPTQEEYLGYIQNGLKQGYGELKTSDEKRYYGYFKDNLPHIKGVLIFSPDHFYMGQFNNGKMHGKGKETSPFFTYEGEYCSDSRKYGKLTTEQFKYEGSFEPKDNLFGGYGQLQFKTGQKYLGNFQQGQFNGEGMYYDQTGFLIYEGAWKNGLYHGFGKYYWEDGSYFEGWYCNGLKHGQGKYFKEGREQIHGVWQNGQITSKYPDNSVKSQSSNIKNNKSSHSTKVEEVY